MNTVIKNNMFSLIVKSFGNMSVPSLKLLVIGQGVIAAYILGFMVSAAVNYGGGSALVYTELTDMIKASITELAAGLSVLWAGALFIDYMCKKYGIK